MNVLGRSKLGFRLDPRALRELRLRVRRVTDFREFSKAQLAATKTVGSIIRTEYRARWAQTQYKRQPVQPSHRAAIRRSMSYLVRRLKPGVFRVRIGASIKTNTLARIVNILNPGFTPYRAKRSVPGKKIREMMLIRGQQIANDVYTDQLTKQLERQVAT